MKHTRMFLILILLLVVGAAVIGLVDFGEPDPPSEHASRDLEVPSDETEDQARLEGRNPREPAVVPEPDAPVDSTVGAIVRLTDTGGRAVSDAQFVGHESEVLADGTWRVFGREAAPRPITIKAPGFETAAFDVALTSEFPLHLLSLEPDPEAWRNWIIGRVEDGVGVGLEGSHVTIRGDFPEVTRRCDVEGRFFVYELPTGEPYTMEVLPPPEYEGILRPRTLEGTVPHRYPWVKLDPVSARGHDLVVEIPKPHPVLARHEDRKKHSVLVRHDHPSWAFTGGGSITGWTRTFHDVWPGTHRIRAQLFARGDGLPNLTFAEKTFVMPEGPHRIELDLARAPEVRGVLGSEPGSGSSVTLISAGLVHSLTSGLQTMESMMKSLAPKAEIDDDGTFRVQAIGVGPTFVVATDGAGRLIASQEVLLEPGFEQDVGTIREGATCVIDCNVVGLESADTSNLEFEIRSSLGVSWSAPAEFDENGRLAVPPLIPGVYRLGLRRISEEGDGKVTMARYLASIYRLHVPDDVRSLRLVWAVRP